MPITAYGYVWFDKHGKMRQRTYPATPPRDEAGARMRAAYRRRALARRKRR